MSKIDLSKLSAEELEAALATKKEEARKEAVRQRALYEMHRDEIVTRRVKQARRLAKILKEFKKETLKEIEDFREKANAYGDIRSTSKGGFSLRNSETGERLSLDRNVDVEYDERADMAEDLIKDFLQDKVKKRDQSDYNAISALLQRNKAGKFSPASIGKFLSIRDNYDDERWIKAMTLFEESYQVREISYSVSFYEKNTMAKDTALVLNFASIAIDEDEDESENENKEEDT